MSVGRRVLTGLSVVAVGCNLQSSRHAESSPGDAITRIRRVMEVTVRVEAVADPTGSGMPCIRAPYTGWPVTVCAWDGTRDVADVPGYEKCYNVQAGQVNLVTFVPAPHPVPNLTGEGSMDPRAYMKAGDAFDAFNAMAGIPWR